MSILNYEMILNQGSKVVPVCKYFIYLIVIVIVLIGPDAKAILYNCGKSGF